MYENRILVLNPEDYDDLWRHIEEQFDEVGPDTDEFLWDAIIFVDNSPRLGRYMVVQIFPNYDFVELTDTLKNLERFADNIDYSLSDQVGERNSGARFETILVSCTDNTGLWDDNPLHYTKQVTVVVSPPCEILLIKNAVDSAINRILS